MEDSGIIFLVFFFDIANLSHVDSPSIISPKDFRKGGNLTPIHMSIIPHNSSLLKLRVFANLDEYSPKFFLSILGVTKPGSKHLKASIPIKNQ